MRILNKFIISSFFILLHAISSSTAPVPTPWPYQFHSILFTNNTEGVLKVLDLWYDWPNGRNFNIIQKQLGKKTYDLDWTNGTKYFYTLDDQKECKILDVGFGILRPNWLEGATYLGQKYMDGFLCNVFTKVDFIWYYEDVVTKRPVYWAFYTGMVAHVITFEVGKVLEDPYWQAPIYCFKEENEQEEESKPLFEALTHSITHGNLVRGVMDASAVL